MAITIIIGAQWGDEGKGKAVDVFAAQSDAVVRFQGGNNAGHTLVVNGQKTVLHLIPSGALYPHIDCFLSRGVVIHPTTLLVELKALSHQGIDLNNRLFISQRAPLIMPWHIEIDRLREATQGFIGTTKKGIGPAYEQFIARQAILADDLRDPERAIHKIELFFPERAALIKALGGTPSTTKEAIRHFHDDYDKTYRHLVPFITDVEAELRRRAQRGDSILFEGAQGTFLDVGIGAYPFVTSSHTTAAGACTGANTSPRHIDRIIGVCKAYSTRVGQGPFPTELAADSKVGQFLQTHGHEFGATTGRPRRCGWLDLVLLKEAIDLNGMDSIVLTKLDVLSGLKEVKIATEYDDQQQPRYKTFPGWTQDLSRAQSLTELPREARDYIDFIARSIAPQKCKISHISVGPGRAQIFELS